AISCGQRRIATLRQCQLPLLDPLRFQPIQSRGHLGQVKREMEAAASNCWQKPLGLMADHQKVCLAWRLFEDFEDCMGSARMHCFGRDDTNHLGTTAMSRNRDEICEAANRP